MCIRDSLESIRQQLRLLAEELSPERIARLLGLAQGQLALLEQSASFAHPGKMILAIRFLRSQIA